MEGITRTPNNREIYDRIKEVLENEQYKNEFLGQPATPEMIYRILERIFRPITEYYK